MKNIALSLSLILAAITLAWCMWPQQTTSLDVTSSIQNDSTVSSLDDKQKQSLQDLADEEKLAYDVYTALYQQWWHKIFANILEAEYKHASLINGLLNKYAITKHDTTSNISNELTQSLIAQWSQSLKEAFAVGRTIETKDIADIDTLMTLFSDYSDILSVLSQLKAGSSRHLQAFQK